MHKAQEVVVTPNLHIVVQGVTVQKQTQAGFLEFHEEVKRIGVHGGIEKQLPEWRCKAVRLNTRGALRSGGITGVLSSAVGLVKSVVVGSDDSEIVLFPVNKPRDGELHQILTGYLRELLELTSQNGHNSNTSSPWGEIHQLLHLLISSPLKPDWPAAFGPIDHTVHDGAHASSRTEWWYLHSHCIATDEKNNSRPISVFVCFFQIRVAVDKSSGKLANSHALTWAISDPTYEKYYQHAILDPATPEACMDMLDGPEASQFHQDKFIRKALREVVAKGNVPLPDRMFDAPVHVSSKGLSLKYGNSGSLIKEHGGSYRVCAKQGDIQLDLVFKPMKDAIRHGNHGVVPGKDGDDMFYYFFPRCEVTGTARIPLVEKKHEDSPAADNCISGNVSVSGSGWFDHEFGGNLEKVKVMNFASKKDDVEHKGEEVDVNNTSQRARNLENKDTTMKHRHQDVNNNNNNMSDTIEEKDSKSVCLPQRNLELDYAWTWVAIQLENDVEVSAAVLYNTSDLDQNSKPKIIDVKAVIIDKDGTRSQYSTDCDNTCVLKEQVQFTVQTEVEGWMSKRTFREYPIAFRLQVPEAQLDLSITASFPDQEFVTILCRPAFWEGRCDVAGRCQGEQVSGLAFIERNGFGSNQSVSDFFKAVGAVVRKSASEMYPLKPTFDEAQELIASKETPQYMEGVPLDVLGETLMGPVRLIADRGGKSWRSYGALACVDCVGGDSRGILKWIAFPEFLHVGSLIIDDIQDRSLTRRGGPCAHLVYGEPLAINAGTAAYFLVERLIKLPCFTKDQLLRFYDLYFSALRGGHAGQALDIYGNDHLMPEVIETGHTEQLERAILGIHRLKTAVPAGTLARMGAVAGGGSEEQIESLGIYFESVGLAFQIMDDVLNLRGLYAKQADKLKRGTVLKSVGEDIAEGKVTMPVCKAMSILRTKGEREQLWNAISSKPQEQSEIDKIIAQLESLGAIDRCVHQADELVKDAWETMDPVIPDSFAKMMLRAFGWFVVERCG